MATHQDKLRVSGGDAQYRAEHDRIFSSKDNKDVMPSSIWEEVRANGRITYRKRKV